MRTITSITSLILLYSTLSCNAQQASNINLSTLSPAIADCPVISSSNGYTGNYFPVHATPTISTDLFSIQYTNNGKLVTNKQTGEQYILTLNGTTNTIDNTTFANTTILSNARYFTIPLNKPSVAETITETYIEMLGVRNTIAYDVLDYTTSPCIQLAASKGLIQQINQTLDDKLCQAVWGNTVTYDAAAGGYSNAISFSVDLEKTILGRAEWIKYTAAFYNKEAAAEVIFNTIAVNYNMIKNNASKAAQNNRPNVAWIWYNSDIQYGKPYNIYTTAYRKNLTGDAGGNLVAPTTIAFDYVDDFLNTLQQSNTDILIDETYQYIYNTNGTASLAFHDIASWLAYLNITSQQNQTYAFLHNVWRDDKSQTPTNLTSGTVGHDDWFESAYPNADAVLKDVVSFVQPTAIEPGYNTIWFRSLVQGTPIEIIAQCSDISTPRPPILDTVTPAQYESYQCPSFLLDPKQAYATSNAYNVNTIVTTILSTVVAVFMLMF